MNFRITDQTSNADFTSGINKQRNRINVFQERILTGKRINRPSDDPSGAESVLRLRTSQTEIGQFQRNAQTANQKLSAVDGPLDNYQTMLERVKTLITQGLSDTITPLVRQGLAIEIETLRTRIINVANSQNSDEYIFGGTRQNAPPFDYTTGIPANTPTRPQYIQIEPGVNAIAVGVTAETIFSDATSTVFADLTRAANAMRGTGDPVADKATLQTTITRLGTFRDLAINAQTVVGANMSVTEIASENLDINFLSYDERVTAIEGADFGESAIGLSDAERALEATLQIAATGRRSLFDFLG